MLKIFNQSRRTGKTTKVIGLLESDLNALLIIPMQSMKLQYKGKVENDIKTYDDILNRRVNLREYSKVVIDEGFLANKVEIAKLYYILGLEGVEVVSYGTIEG